jgi:phosphoribosyl 1,2-cyclic phosphodiesterase
MLIDCGIGPRIAAARMKGLGVCLADVRAICLTHLDSDHFKPAWISTILRQEIAVFCHEDKVPGLIGLCGGSAEFARSVRTFNGHPFDALDGIAFTAIPFRHDAVGSHGFVAEGFGCRMGYATDLGRVEPRLIRDFRGVNLLAIESNYDPQMQLVSPRPWFLKQRIMGGAGHLSNEEALHAVQRIISETQVLGMALPKHIVLLHRSRQCNCPRRLRELFSADPLIGSRLVLAEQDRPTGWLNAGARQTFAQLELQWS